MNCDVCGKRSDAMMVVGSGLGDEMSLCEDCAAIAFPGLREMMRHDCPICRGESAGWN